MKLFLFVALSIVTLSTEAFHNLFRLAKQSPSCLKSSEANDFALSAPVWISRRSMIASGFSAAVAPWVYKAASAHADAGDEYSWMADPGPLFEKASKVLAKEAELAGSRVTQANIVEYEKTGVTKVKNVVSEQWIQLLRDGCDLAQDEAGPFAEYLHKSTDQGIFFTDLELARRLPLYAAFALYGPAAAVAGNVMGSTSVRYLYDQIFVKEKGVSTVTPWHQDGGYWRVKGEQVASVFVPLDPVTPQAGLQFVRGSHRWQLHNPQHFADGTPYIGTSLPEMPDIAAMAKRNEVVLDTFSLQPGDVLVFSAKTVHGGPGNWGRALSTRWVGDDARFWDRPGEGAVPTGDVKLRDGDLLAGNPAAFPVSWKA